MDFADIFSWKLFHSLYRGGSNLHLNSTKLLFFHLSIYFFFLFLSNKSVSTGWQCETHFDSSAKSEELINSANLGLWCSFQILYQNSHFPTCKKGRGKKIIIKQQQNFIHQIISRKLCFLTWTLIETQTTSKKKKKKYISKLIKFDIYL